MKNIDKDEYGKLLIDFDTSIDDGSFTDEEEYDRLETLLINGQLTDADVDEVYFVRDITSKQRSDFKLAIDKRKTSTFNKADAYLKKAIGYEDTRISMGDSEEKNLAFEQYRNKSNELYDYMINNPGISSMDLMDKAKEIVSIKTTDTDLKVKIGNINTNIQRDKKKYGGFTLMNNTFVKYVRDANPDINNMQDFRSNYLGSSDNLDNLITILRSIQNIPEGGSVKRKVEGKFLEQNITRPFNVSDDNLDKFIADVKALQQLYDQQGNN